MIHATSATIITILMITMLTTIRVQAFISVLVIRTIGATATGGDGTVITDGTVIPTGITGITRQPLIIIPITAGVLQATIIGVAIMAITLILTITTLTTTAAHIL